ncbi:hypothetical protein [Psychrobacillus antarcticus]|uniref:hypothetical protein n=1 Tax=Psychrobacillus antarcticus TaxID=2879115 RepID=UPI002407933F|nr:hypothetical protein [Psychrobacillus antarcticus]
MNIHGEVNNQRRVESVKNGRDGGFNYWKMNYRTRLLRTLWMVPVVLFLSIQLLVMDIPPKSSVFLLVLLLVTLVVQLIYTYFKWKSERQTETH